MPSIKLYKRSKKDIVIWTIKCIGNKITIRFGQFEGKLQEVVKIIDEGKNINKSNETTSEQQALLEYQSLINLKKDQGYKSAEELNYNSNSTISLYEWLMINLPKFNTDANNNVKPMLAQSVKNDFKNVNFPCFIQPKLDGVRCLMIVDRTLNDEVIFLSRSGKEYTTLNHIAEVINQIDDNRIPLQFILDGEIYSDELTFQEIVSAVKAENENSHKLKFRCYDIVNEDFQATRIIQYTNICLNINSELIKIVDSALITNKDEVLFYFKNYIESGYEGAMLRLNNGLYEQGFRSKSLLKYKEFDESEFTIINFELGERGTEDLIFVCVTKELKEFRAKSMGTKAYKEEVYNNKNKLIASNATIKHFGFTDDKFPRFPIAKALRDYE